MIEHTQHHPPILHASTMRAQSLPWMEPLALASGINEEYWILLYSSVNAGYSGRYSYLAHDLAERLECNDFESLETKISATGTRFDPAWFGYLGYGLKDNIETLTHEAPNWLTLANSFWMRFHRIYEFDHEKKTVTLWSDDASVAAFSPTSSLETVPQPAVKHLTSSMTEADYLQKVSDIIKRIHAGDLYQANLTRKFIGEFATNPNAFSLFQRLCHVSPAPYSAFLKLGETSMMSSSPERFLNVSADGKMTTRPIKGTAPRFSDLQEDKNSREKLKNSQKDRAENLMIADLMRNDLARSCELDSIKADSLFEVTTHATIHHLSSTISGQKRADCSTLDAVKKCFPPGSMTGAPKIKAMNLCAELEHYARGVYSGAIGWFGGDGSCDLSVVIRTLIVHNNRFEFQVGGGIVADSAPEKELEETFQKAKGILHALNVPTEKLRNL